MASGKEVESMTITANIIIFGALALLVLWSMTKMWREME